MAKSKSSQRWLQEHFKDPYVARAQREGFRSRAVYKLMEIQQKDAILFSGARVVDLGAAPGGWSQYASTQVGENGIIIANDLLPIDPLPQVEFVQGDFRDDDVLQQLIDLLNNKQADLVISDMAPNMSGVGAVDQPRSVYLCELALEMAKNVLKPDGCFLVKVFQGEGSEAVLKATRSVFKSVKIRKPSASRPRSREVYMLAQGYML